MLAAAAVCPHPPLLVPEVAAGAADETADLRAACLAAVATLVECAPDVLVVVGDASETTAFSSADSGSLAGYGVDVTVALGPRLCAGRPILPLSLTVGAWLLRQTAWTGDRQGYGIASTATLDDALQAGREIAALDGRVGILCLGDGSARRDEKAPGYVDARAADFDARVAHALGTADLDVLKALDSELAGDLWCSGVRSWQVLAGAAEGGSWRARLLCETAPYGVGYFVASWDRTQS